jgi:ATP-dependent DNA helicase RecG
VDRRLRASIREALLPGVVTVEVRIDRHLPPKAKGKPHVVVVSDAQTTFNLVFFHARGRWVEDAFRWASGASSRGASSSSTAWPHGAPEHVTAVAEAGTIPGFEPTYPLGGGLTQRLVFKATRGALALVPELPEWIDGPLREREGWPAWRDALHAAHAPQASADVQPDAPARERLAYDELLAHQLTLALARATARRQRGQVTRGDGRLRAQVLATLPYELTGAQARALSEIEGDLASPRRMNRLLQGDVGSGKTLVAFLALLVAVEAGGQGALMAPTGILAQQHLEALRPLAEDAGVRIEILTGRDKGSERASKLAALADGTIGVLVGTHALFQRGVEFQDLRLAVVDEQHRFGVAQRMELGAKGALADVLVMTATPIPRSLALAQYGDMDVSVLDEKPRAACRSPPHSCPPTVSTPWCRACAARSPRGGRPTGSARSWRSRTSPTSRPRRTASSSCAARSDPAWAWFMGGCLQPRRTRPWPTSWLGVPRSWSPPPSSRWASTSPTRPSWSSSAPSPSDSHSSTSSAVASGGARPPRPACSSTTVPWARPRGDA